MNIGLTFDVQTDPADERQAEFDPPATVDALQAALESLGHRVIRLGSAHDLISRREHLDRLDLVFNLAEGRGGRCREAWVPMLLEQWGVPYVGSSPSAQALGLDKVMSKRLAAASGVSTPRWFVMARAEAEIPPARCVFPAIVKPQSEGSGLGIGPSAIVHDEEALRRRVGEVVKRFGQPCLVEEFIPFGELTVFLIGNAPPQALPAIQRPLDPATRLSCHVARAPDGTAWLVPLDLTPALDAAARQAAVAVFDALRCRDMARVDFRVDEQGRLYFLEINPLPSFSPTDSLGLLAEYLGTTYASLIGRIVETAMRRLKIASATAPSTKHQAPSVMRKPR